MKKLFLVCLSLSIAAACFAQRDENGYLKKQLAYHSYRLTVVEPPYALKKVKRLMKGLVEDQEDNERLPDKVFNSLSFDEKFTYVMLHGETYMQNCDALERMDDEDQRIFASFPGGFGDETRWSDRQEAFARKNRTKFIPRLRTLIRSRSRVGINVKYATVQLGGFELIPDLVAAYKRTPKDLDILTTLTILMEQGKYEPFMKSASYKKLYAQDARWDAYLVANKENRQLICDRAMAFSKSRKK